MAPALMCASRELWKELSSSALRIIGVRGGFFLHWNELMAPLFGFERRILSSSLLCRWASQVASPLSTTPPRIQPIAWSEIWGPLITNPPNKVLEVLISKLSLLHDLALTFFYSLCWMSYVKLD